MNDLFLEKKGWQKIKIDSTRVYDSARLVIHAPKESQYISSLVS